MEKSGIINTNYSIIKSLNFSDNVLFVEINTETDKGEMNE